jgi:hypothetical protein
MCGISVASSGVVVADELARPDSELPWRIRSVVRTSLECGFKNSS